MTQSQKDAAKGPDRSAGGPFAADSTNGAETRVLWNGVELEPHLIRELKERSEAIQGWLDWRAGAALYALARFEAPTPVAVEIGAWKGKSTIWIAGGLRDRPVREGSPRHVVYSVDTWQGSPNETLHQELLRGYLPGQLLAEFKASIRAAALDAWVQPIEAESGAAAQAFPRDLPVGLLYIDASHDYLSVRRDFENWSPMVAVGGFVVFDDVPSWPGPSRVISELPGWYRFVGSAPNQWIVRKTN